MFVEIDGVRINYEIAGEGEPLLLLHGWGGSTQSFSPVVDYFKGKFKVISLEFPGFGKSQIPNTVWSIKDYAECTLKFIVKLNLKNPILLGHSFGGRVIIYLLGNKMLEAKKVILVDSAGIKPKRPVSYYLKVYSFKLIKNILRCPLWKSKTGKIIERARSFFGSNDYKQADPMLRQIMVTVVNEDLKHLLPNINVSTLLIWGENDKATPVKDGKVMEKLIPDAGLVVLKEAGHFSYLEKRVEFNIIADKFLS